MEYRELFLLEVVYRERKIVEKLEWRKRKGVDVMKGEGNTIYFRQVICKNYIAQLKPFNYLGSKEEVLTG